MNSKMILSDELPNVTPERFHEIFQALVVMDVRLDMDPLMGGPKRMNRHVAKLRNFLSECEQVHTELSHDLAIYKRRLRKKEAELKLQKNALFVGDAETRSGKSAADREAVAMNKLKDLVEDVRILEDGVAELEMVLVVVKSKKTDLKDIQNRLRDQFKIVQEEIKLLGGRWEQSLEEAGDEDDVLKTIDALLGTEDDD